MSADEDGRRLPDDSFSMWTVYDHPADFPNNFVAREWIIVRGPAGIVITDNVIIGSLERVRERLQAKGLTRISSGHPTITKTWI